MEWWSDGVMSPLTHRPTRERVSNVCFLQLTFDPAGWKWEERKRKNMTGGREKMKGERDGWKERDSLVHWFASIGRKYASVSHSVNFSLPSVFWAAAGCWLAERVTWPQSTSWIQWKNRFLFSNVTKETTRQSFGDSWNIPLVTSRPHDPSSSPPSFRAASEKWRRKKREASGPGHRASRLYFPASQRIISQFIQLEAFHEVMEKKERNEKKKILQNGKTQNKILKKKKKLHSGSTPPPSTSGCLHLIRKLQEEKKEEEEEKISSKKWTGKTLQSGASSQVMDWEPGSVFFPFRFSSLMKLGEPPLLDLENISESASQWVNEWVTRSVLSFSRNAQRLWASVIRWRFSGEPWGHLEDKRCFSCCLFHDEDVTLTSQTDVIGVLIVTRQMCVFIEQMTRDKHVCVAQ